MFPYSQNNFVHECDKLESLCANNIKFGLKLVLIYQ